MDSILVVGTDTIVGANLAAHWQDADRPATGRPRVSDPADFADSPALLDEARAAVAVARPDRVVYCGPGADSAWAGTPVTAADEAVLRVWVRAATDAGCRLTYLSSDAIFTGPWLFHAENDPHHCGSREALRLRAMEELVTRVDPTALVVRTHAFGWSPAGPEGFLETLMADLERGTAAPDPTPHATPILATDLADILDRAHEESLTGLLHAAGAERIGRAAFARRVADEFGLPVPEVATPPAPCTPARGFARGETSLHTRRARNVLNRSMPLPADGLARLRAQSLTGFRDRLCDTADRLQRAA